MVKDSTVEYLTGGNAEAAEGIDGEGVQRFRINRRVVHTPTLIPSLATRRVIKVSSGHAHVVALTDTHEMLSSGYNDRGQLGHGTRMNSSAFRPVRGLDGVIIVDVACGQQHNIAISALSGHPAAATAAVGAAAADFPPGSVFTWGSGALGALGQGATVGDCLEPTLVSHEELPPVKSVASGANFCVALSEAGAVFSWGHSEYGQHGTRAHGEHDSRRQGSRRHGDARYYYVPRQNMSATLQGRNIQQVQCGSQFTIACDEEGDVITWGWNSFGVLGHGRGGAGMNPKVIEALEGHHVMNVQAGDNVRREAGGEGIVSAHTTKPLPLTHNCAHTV